MSNSLRIAPAASHPTHLLPGPSAPSAPGLHDTLRATLTPLPPPTTTTTTPPTQLRSTHPLESRLANWRATQQNLKHTLLRRQFGMSAPLIREMELLTVANGDAARPGLLLAGGTSEVHGDILTGRDCECSWEDVYTGDGIQAHPDFHAEMENRLGMDW